MGGLVVSRSLARLRRGARLSRLLVPAALCGLAVLSAGPASAAWRQPVGGTNPINNGTGSAVDPSLTVIGGVPHLAWREADGTNFEVRVTRLNAAETDWEQVASSANPASPINAANNRNAGSPSLTSLGGDPYVGWTEADGTNAEVRVAHPNAAGTDWVELVGGENPINNSTSNSAEDADLLAIGGVLYVAWRECNAGTCGNAADDWLIRVARYNPIADDWQEVASPLNKDVNQDGFQPSLAQVGGVPHVAWAEHDGTNLEIHVARLNGAGNAWERIGESLEPQNPINSSSTLNANSPSLELVGDTLHVAWREDNGNNWEIRAARLNPAGTGWDEIVGGPSPINAGSATGGEDQTSAPSLVGIGGAPYVAWHDFDGGSTVEARVARLNPAGTAWEEVVGGASPINDTDSSNGVDLGQIGGVPWAAWSEEVPGRMRVARLEPEFLSLSESPLDTSATLMPAVRTYGVDYPFGFDFGQGTSLGTQLPVVTARSGNADSAIASQTIGGLSRSTTYSWRAFATDGVRRIVTSPSRTFTTLAFAPGQDVVAAVISRARAVPSTFAVNLRGRAERPLASARRRAKRGTTFRYTLSEPARVVFRIERKTRGRRVGRKCRRQTPRNRRRRACARYVRVGAFAHNGRARANRKRFSGKIGRRRLRPGRYRAVLRATDPAGNVSRPRRVRFRVVRR